MATRTRRTSSTAGRSRRAAEPEEMINEDYSDEEYREPGEGYQGEQPTKGLYTCKLVEIKNHETAEGSKSRRWTFELVPGSENKHGDDVSGWRDYRYTNNDTTKWLEQQMLVALGVIKPGGKVKLSYAGIVKKASECTVRVDVERYIPEDGDAEWRGRMGAFLPLREAGPKSRRGGRNTDPEDDPDEEDEEEVDEEDEKPAPRSRRSRGRKAEVVDDDVADEDADEPDEDEEEIDPDELAAELADLTLVQLKRRARDEFGVKIARGMDADAIIDAVLETLDEDEEDEEEDEPEEEPEPPKRRSSRAGGRATASKTRSRRSRASDDEPPF